MKKFIIPLLFCCPLLKAQMLKTEHRTICEYVNTQNLKPLLPAKDTVALTSKPLKSSDCKSPAPPADKSTVTAFEVVRPDSSREQKQLPELLRTPNFRRKKTSTQN